MPLTFMSTPIYDTIGRSYAQHRRPDPRIAARIHAALGDAQSVLNIGAGAGSYEPTDRHVVAVEPSMVMIAQRPAGAAAVCGRAEALAFDDDSFDAVMGILTLHHWADRLRGLAECMRVARQRVVLLTVDPFAEAFWLVRDYFPSFGEADRRAFPPMREYTDAFGASACVEITTVPVPRDCVDGFLGAYWARPAAYLDPAVRAGISSFSKPGLEEGIERLRADLESGAWRGRHGHLLSLDELDVGYRLVVADLTIGASSRA